MTMSAFVSKLEAIAQAAIAVTLDEPGAATVHGQELIAELATALECVRTRPHEMLPVVEHVLAVIESAVVKAPQPIARMASSHLSDTFKWRRDMPRMPNKIVAFVVRDRLRIAREKCSYLLAKARYEALCKTGDRCDCAARVAACFMFHRPTGPLDLEDSSGVPFAAMDYRWRCKACGTRWHEEEGHDDNGSQSTWCLAP